MTAALLVKVPEADARTDLQWLSDFYGLTSAELQLVRGLANGDSLKNLAAWQGVSYETVRTHLRRVFDKTGTNRQVALVELVRNAC
ncbi:Bacterial regulatory protein, luxR family [compost metagenome]